MILPFPGSSSTTRPVTAAGTPFARPLRRTRAVLTTRTLDLRAGGDAARRRLAATIRVEPSRVARAEQVHGPRLAVVEAGGVSPGVDALATRSEGLAVLALGADCPGVALLSDEIPAVAVAHSGWRGAVADVSSHASAQLVAWGARARDLTAWVGPGIGACCFEVGDEVVAAFEQAHGPLGALVSRPRGGKPHIDLKGAIARRLVEHAGLLPENVVVAPECTRCEAELLFSRRREGPGCGHHAVVAWIPPLDRLEAL